MEGGACQRIPIVQRLGQASVTVEVRDLGFRWGSARPTDGPQHINIHWATLQLPPTLIDYVLVHELAHLRELNHTPKFWSTADRLMPGYETQRIYPRRRRQAHMGGFDNGGSMSSKVGPSRNGRDASHRKKLGT